MSSTSCRLPLLLLVVIFTGGCTWELILASLLASAGDSARYTLQLHNDEVMNTGLEIYTVGYVPQPWQLTSAVFVSSGTPGSGFGSEIADPLFDCTTGPALPAPGLGRKRVVISWGTYDVNNPQTAMAELTFAVGQSTGTYPVDFHFVARKAASTVCSVAVSATTQVVPAILADGFESGLTSAWSGVVP